MTTKSRPTHKTKSKRSAPTAVAPTSVGGLFAALKELVTGGGVGEAPKATALLEAQHRETEKQFAAVLKANGNAKALVHTLASSLLAHMLIEEKIFYPAAKAFKEGLVLEGYEEHVVARFALERLLVTSPKDKSFKAKAKTLKDIIESHVKEEENDLFPKIEKSMSGDELRALGAKMKRLFDATVEAGWAKTLAAEGPNVSKGVRRASATRSATT